MYGDYTDFDVYEKNVRLLMGCHQHCSYYVILFILLTYPMILTIIDFDKKHDVPFQGVFYSIHPKNPVGREWQLKIDNPLMIVDEDVKIRVSMIKEVCRIRGVKLDRRNDAHTVKHFALSLSLSLANYLPTQKRAPRQSKRTRHIYLSRHQ